MTDKPTDPEATARPNYSAMLECSQFEGELIDESKLGCCPHETIHPSAAGTEIIEQCLDSLGLPRTIERNGRTYVRVLGEYWEKR